MHSHKTHIDNMSTIANTALGSANSVLACVNGVSLIVYTSNTNGLALRETVTGVQQNLAKTYNVLNTSVNNARMMLGTLNSTF